VRRAALVSEKQQKTTGDRGAVGNGVGASNDADGAVHAATAKEQRVGGVDGGVNAERSEVSSDDFELNAADPARQHRHVSGRDRDTLLGEKLL
jgi:hypothetical protein